MKDLDKFRGCLIGGAAGDALGYPVEFMDEDAIFSKYGEGGIKEFELVNNEALVSDDTQMTLFTANGLLLGTTRRAEKDEFYPYFHYVSVCYRDWLRTQDEKLPSDEGREKTYSWLYNVDDMFGKRAPGFACMSAIRSGKTGMISDPVNADSKGCGGVMRVAPVGLYFELGCRLDSELDMIGAQVAAITHGHELGYIPAATLTHIIRRLTYEDMSINEAVSSAMDATAKLFPGSKYLGYYTELMERAVRLAKEDAEDLDAIHELGEGWVAEEALAIAVYCALKYEDDFEKAVIAAVNHKGDSDSTGSITGNIVGAHVGLKGIPDKFVSDLELREVILEIATDLYNDYSDDEIWARKYKYMTYPK